MTNPHISSIRGATFRNSDDYLYAANFAVGQWQTAYGDGVHVGTSADVCLIDDDLDENGDCYVGYGAFPSDPNSNLNSNSPPLRLHDHVLRPLLPY
jgi:hypothetical protein